MKMRLGSLENRVLAYVQAKKINPVKMTELILPLGLSKEQLKEVFKQLTRGQLIAKVNRGIYLFPSQLPLSGVWLPDETQALNALMLSLKAKYQVCGPNAFNRYGFVDQVPNRIYAYNDKVSSLRKIGVVVISLIKVGANRLGSTETVVQPDGGRMIYSSRLRTLIDGVYDWARFNTLPQAYSWISAELKGNRIKPADLINEVLKFGDIGTIRRMGVLLEKLAIKPSLINMLEQSVRSTRSTIPWIPGRPKRGRVNTRWNVIENGVMD